MGVVFNKCCCCIDLRLGCLIIGYLQLIEFMAIAVYLSCLAIGIGLIPEDQQPVSTNLSISVVAVTSIFCLLSLVFSIVLLVGIHEQKPGYIKAYLDYTLIMVILYPIMILTTLVIAIGSKPASTAVVVIKIVRDIYFLLVIRSHYVRMDDPSV